MVPTSGEIFTNLTYVRFLDKHVLARFDSQCLPNNPPGHTQVNLLMRVPPF